MVNKFWEEKVEWRNNKDSVEDSICVRADGCHYTLSTKPSMFKGFGGAKHCVEFISGPHKGKRVICNNVWSQGRIPQEYKDKLPDNAIFFSSLEDFHKDIEKYQLVEYLY